VLTGKSRNRNEPDNRNAPHDRKAPNRDATDATGRRGMSR